MSSISDNYESEWVGDPPQVARWWSWPLREHIFRAMATLAGLGLAGWAVYNATEKIHLTVLAVTVLLVGLWRFLVPVLFELNSDGVNLWVFGRHQSIPWSEIHDFDTDTRGVFLLPSTEGAVIDAVRGLYVPWGKHRDEVLALVHYYLDTTEE